MKRALVVLMSVMLVLTAVVGCSGANGKQGETPQSPKQDSQEEIAYKDGIYTAEGETDERGWKPIIEITVKNGKITDVYYDEVKEDGTKKSTDQDYYANFLEKGGTDVRKAYETLENSLVEVQDPDKVDTFSGATSSSNNMKELAAKALEGAK